MRNVNLYYPGNSDNSNKAADVGRSSGGGGGGTYTLGSNSPQQVIKAAGGGTLKNTQQRAISDSRNLTVTI